MLPGIVERHRLGPTRLMLASTLAGEANAAAVIRDLLKHDELVAAAARRAAPARAVIAAAPTRRSRARGDQGRRQEQKRKKQADARTRREQSAQGARPRLTALGRQSGQLEAEHLAFVVQQPRLRLQPTAEADERAVAADDAVARHDDRQRVAAVGGADRPGLAGQPDAAPPARRS